MDCSVGGRRPGPRAPTGARRDEVPDERRLRVVTAVGLREHPELRVDPKFRSTRVPVHRGSFVARSRPSYPPSPFDAGCHGVRMAVRFLVRIKELIEEPGALPVESQSPSRRQVPLENLAHADGDAAILALLVFLVGAGVLES